MQEQTGRICQRPFYARVTPWSPPVERRRRAPQAPAESGGENSSMRKGDLRAPRLRNRGHVVTVDKYDFQRFSDFKRAFEAARRMSRQITAAIRLTGAATMSINKGLGRQATFVR